jgi:hypothetical protein
MRRFDENPGLSMSGFFVAHGLEFLVLTAQVRVLTLKKVRLFTFVKTFSSGIVVNLSVAILIKRVSGKCEMDRFRSYFKFNLLFAFRPKCGGLYRNVGYSRQILAFYLSVSQEK